MCPQKLVLQMGWVWGAWARSLLERNCTGVCQQPCVHFLTRVSRRTVRPSAGPPASPLHSHE